MLKELLFISVLSTSAIISSPKMSIPSTSNVLQVDCDIPYITNSYFLMCTSQDVGSSEPDVMGFYWVNDIDMNSITYSVELGTNYNYYLDMNKTTGFYVSYSSRYISYNFSRMESGAYNSAEWGMISSMRCIIDSELTYIDEQQYEATYQDDDDIFSGEYLDFSCLQFSYNMFAYDTSTNHYLRSLIIQKGTAFTNYYSDGTYFRSYVFQLFGVNPYVETTSIYTQEQYDSATANSYQKGYDEGLQDGNESSGFIVSIFSTILGVPSALIGDMFDFEIFGLNISNLIFGFITILLVVWLIKKFMSGSGGSDS